MRKRIAIATLLLAVLLVIAPPLVMWTRQFTAPRVREGMYLSAVLPDLRRAYDDVQIKPTVDLDSDPKERRSLVSCTKTDLFGRTSLLYLRLDGDDRITHVETVAERARWEDRVTNLLEGK
jgi:hypothetical protein